MSVPRARGMKYRRLSLLFLQIAAPTRILTQIFMFFFLGKTNNANQTYKSKGKEHGDVCNQIYTIIILLSLGLIDYV